MNLPDIPGQKKSGRNAANVVAVEAITGQTDYDPDRDDGPFFHSSRLALVDAQRRIRGYYEGAESAEVDRLRKDLAHLQQ